MNVIHDTYWLFTGAAALVLIGIISSLVARRFGAPLLLVFLVIGMLAGVDGPGGFAFDNYTVTYRIGSLALAIILFDGGLRTQFASFRGVLAPTVMLATVGVVITAILTGMAASWLLQLGRVEGFLLGTVVASTDAAAVFFLLRAGGLQLRQRIGSTLEIESTTNDPVAVLLTTLLVEYLLAPQGLTLSALALELMLQIAVGASVGAAGGWAIARALNRLPLSGGLAALFLLGGAVLLFGLTGSLHGSAFLAVYIAGLVIGNRRVSGFGQLLGVLDAATWLCQIVMFLVLGLLVTPSELASTLWPALGIAAFLMFFGRPLAVLACLAPFGYGNREVAFISWVGLRGAVGIFLASIPMLMHLPNANLYFNVAFIVVLVSLLVQGWTLAPAARLFNIALPHRVSRVRRVELDLPGSLELELVGYPVVPESTVLAGRPIPAWARFVLVVRSGEILMPELAGALTPGDYAYFLAPPGRLYRLDWLFASPEQAREAERELFGEFSFDANVALGEIAAFYNLPVDAQDATLTLAEHFAKRYEHTVQIGDRVDLRSVILVARELADDGVSKVGLKFKGVSGALAQRAQRQRSRLAIWLAR